MQSRFEIQTVGMRRLYNIEMDTLLIKEKISEEVLKKIREESSAMVKLVVDVARGTLSLGCFLHIDCYEKLLEDGSQPKDLWGANFYPTDGRIDFISLVNIKPPFSRSMDITDLVVRKRLEEIIHTLLF